MSAQHEIELPELDTALPDAPEARESEGYSPSNKTYKWKWIYADEFDEYEQAWTDRIFERETQLRAALTELAAAKEERDAALSAVRTYVIALKAAEDDLALAKGAA